MKEVEMPRNFFFVVTVFLTVLAVSSLRACDPGEEIRKVNSSLTTTSGDNLSTPNLYYNGWGFPRSVEVSNYDGDCFPWISGNGQYLLFSSINFNGPPRFGHRGSWDIYRSEWNDVNQCWDEPENLGDFINTGLDERRPSCDADCDTIYFYQIGLSGNGNIYRSSWDSIGQFWTIPESLPAPVNTLANEEHPALSADGMRLYFTSDRLYSGRLDKDIWVAFWNGSEWDSVINLGAPINTPNEETRPFESYDGLSLFFTNQHAQPRAEGCYGGWSDIYVAFWTGSGWDNISVVAAPVNNDLVACSPCESPDGKQLYFGSEAYEGGRGDEDIWVATKSVLWPPSTVPGYGNWMKTGELENAVFVYDLVENPGGIIYAATACADTIPMGRVFKTINGGASWTPCADLTGTMIVYSLLLVGDTIYAGTYPNGDVFKSINGGSSWVNTANLSGVTSVRALARLQNGDILVSTAPHDTSNHNRLYRTTNGGISWTLRASLTGINPGKFLYQVSNGVLFTGGWGIDSYVFTNRSTDNGATWDSITVVPQSQCDWSVDAFYEASDNTLYIMGWYPSQTVGTGGGFIYKSFDNGITWDTCSKIMRGDGVHNGRVYDMAEDLSGTLFVGMQPAYDSVVFASSDGGDSWYSTGGLDGAFECLCLLKASDGTIYAGTTPNGDVFKYIPTGIIEQDQSTIPDARSLEISPSPFRDKLKIQYTLSTKQEATIQIYDITGRIIKSFPRSTVYALRPTVFSWDATDNYGDPVSRGVYFVLLETPGFCDTKKIIYLK